MKWVKALIISGIVLLVLIVMVGDDAFWKRKDMPPHTITSCVGLYIPLDQLPEMPNKDDCGSFEEVVIILPHKEEVITMTYNEFIQRVTR